VVEGKTQEECARAALAAPPSAGKDAAPNAAQTKEE